MADGRVTVMADDDNHRSITMTRTASGRFRAVNVRGGELEIGGGDDTDFTPVELLLTAIGGCSGIDVDLITGRRAQPESFTVTVQANKVRDGDGNHLADITASFALTFPAGPDGDAARQVLPEAVRKSQERLCTVSRTVELPTPVTMTIE
jgi:uncharacterized OsmC-like protein